jgi:hypothetical protein
MTRRAAFLAVILAPFLRWRKAEVPHNCDTEVARRGGLLAGQKVADWYAVNCCICRRPKKAHTLDQALSCSLVRIDPEKGHRHPHATAAEYEKYLTETSLRTAQAIDNAFKALNQFTPAAKRAAEAARMVAR